MLRQLSIAVAVVVALMVALIFLSAIPIDHVSQLIVNPVTAALQTASEDGAGRPSSQR